MTATRSASDTIPESVQPFLTITEIDDARFIAGALFRRKYAQTPPEVPRHLAAFHRTVDGTLRLAGYSHMRPYEEVYLSGGSCTDGATIRAMSAAQREALYAAGGVLFLILKYAFAKYAGECEAFFGHCGDARALEVTRAAGFVETGFRHVIAHFHRPLPDVRRRELTAKVAALGPF